MTNKIFCDNLFEINKKGYFLNDISSTNFIFINNDIKFIDLEFINMLNEMEANLFKIKNEEIFNVNKENILESDKIKLSYMFLKLITMYDLMEGDLKTKLYLINDFLKPTNFLMILLIHYLVV